MNKTAADSEMDGLDRLITNLGYATIVRGGQPVRTRVSALLLQDREPLFQGKPREQVVMGFGPDLAWPVFDLRLGCGRLEYEMASYERDTGPAASTPGKTTSTSKWTRPSPGDARARRLLR